MELNLMSKKKQLNAYQRQRIFRESSSSRNILLEKIDYLFYLVKELLGQKI